MLRKYCKFIYKNFCQYFNVKTVFSKNLCLITLHVSLHANKRRFESPHVLCRWHEKSLPVDT